MSSFANASGVFLSLSLRLVSSKWLNRWLRKSNPTKLHGRFDWGQQVRNNFDVSARSTDFGSLDKVAIGAVFMLKLRIRTTAAQQANYMVFACATMSLAVQLLRFPKDLMNHSHVSLHVLCTGWPCATLAASYLTSSSAKSSTAGSLTSEIWINCKQREAEQPK